MINRLKTYCNVQYDLPPTNHPTHFSEHSIPDETDPDETSPMIKQKSLLKMINMLVPKKGSGIKSKPKKWYRKRWTQVEDLYNNDEDKLSVMERVEEVLDNIADDCPSFVKCMLPSNVSHGFWLIFPKKFCSAYLPIILVSECGKEFETNYLVDRHGLSGGWRGFSVAQRILKGDLLVFQLVKPCTLKVHIVRGYGLDEVDAAIGLMNIVAHAEGTSPGKKMKTKTKAKSVKPLLQWNTNYTDLAECS